MKPFVVILVAGLSFAPTLDLSPGVVFTTGFGGTFVGFLPTPVAVDAQGNVYIAGSTFSATLPVTSGVFQPTPDLPDVFVAKLDRNGGLVYLTYLGGNDSRADFRNVLEYATGIAVDSAGQVVVAGLTASTNFPVVNAWQPMPQAPSASRYDGFVTKLNASGSQVVFSTYVGGTDGSTSMSGVALDPGGNVYVAGTTAARSFPATSALGPASSVSVPVVLKLNPAGGRVYATRLGGSGREIVSGLAVDASGAVLLTGRTFSLDFPTVNAVVPACPPEDPPSSACSSSFVAKLNPAGTGLVYSTYFGAAVDDVAAAPDGTAYVASGGQNAHITELASGGAVRTTRQVSAQGVFNSLRLRLDAGQNVYVTGMTSSPNLDVIRPLMAEYPRGPVYRSDDRGAQWRPIGRGLPTGGFTPGATALAVGPTGVLYVVAAGVHRSADGGGAWELLSDSPSVRNSNNIVVDPRTGTTLYAGTMSRSFDGGRSWQFVGSPGLSNVQILAIDPGSPGRVYAGGLGGVSRTVDGGVTWVLSNTGLTSRSRDLTVFSIVVDERNPSTLFAGTADNVFRSADGGITWTVSSAGLAQPFEMRLAIDPSSSQTVYAVGSPAAGVFKSVDGGATWAPSSNGLPAARLTIIAVDPRNPRTLYAGARQAGAEMLYRSDDGGASWVHAGRGLHSNSVERLAIDPRSGALYALGSSDDVPFLIHFTRGLAQRLFSTYFPHGSNPTVAVSTPCDVYMSRSDRTSVVVEKISLGRRSCP